MTLLLDMRWRRDDYMLPSKCSGLRHKTLSEIVSKQGIIVHVDANHVYKEQYYFQDFKELFCALNELATVYKLKWSTPSFVFS